MKKRLTIILITLLAILPLMGLWPLNVQAAYVFSGGGDGSLGNPYVLLTAEDLDNIRGSALLSKHYKLGADIDLSSIANWVPIGTESIPFGGNFDGGYYTISNLTIDSSLHNIGLFGYAQSATAGSTLTTIKNVRLENVNITGRGSYSIGGLSGTIQAWTLVDRISVSGTITGEGHFVGGITGETGSISNSDAHVHINGDFSYAGGLTGYSGYGITQSYETGDVTVTGNNSKAGGLSGFAAGEISNSYATGRIEASNPSSSIGGLIGAEGGEITNSYASGTLVKAAGSGLMGGLIGYSYNLFFYSITNSYWNTTDNPGLTTLGTVPGSTGGVQKSEMENMITLGGWSSTIWGIQEGNGTPYLKTFSPVLRVAPISTTYYTEPIDNVLQVSGHVRDGSIGEPLTIRIAINNDADVTVTDYVYEMPATGDKQVFNWSTLINDQRYPEGAYTLNITVEDTVAGHKKQQSFPFNVQDVTAPTAVVSSTGGSTVNAPFPVTITFSEAVQGFTENDIVIVNGSVSNLVTVTSTTYSATISPTTSGQAVKATVAAGAVTDAAGNANPVSNTLLIQYNTTKPVAAFGSFTQGQLFKVPPAAVTVSVYEAVYWIAGGAQLQAGNALPLISMEKDGAAYTAYTASFDALAHVFTLSLNGTVQDGEYGVLVAGNVVRNVYHNILDAARASFTIDQTPPAAPALVTPANGEWTNDASPTISGTTEAGTTVTIRLDGTAAATVTAAGNGSWMWIPTTALAEGVHTVSASATDAAGNTGSFSAEHAFTVDTQPPVITLVGGASIFLTVGTTFLDPGVTVTDLEENIQVTITGSVNNQVPGTYILQYDAQDSAGNAAVPVTRTVQVNARSTGGGSVQLSSHADLKQLTVRADGDERVLTPIFTAETTSYRVKTSANEVSIEAVASDAKALVSLGGATLVGRKTVALTEGGNVFEIIVKAENGTVKSYSLTIQRQTEAAPSSSPSPSLSPAVIPACTFLDIKGHWAELHICEAAEKGIVDGYSKTEFHPQGLITRVEFTAMLLRTLGAAPGSAADKLFIDQDQIPTWATNMVSQAVEIGILQGYLDGSLRPMQTVSRAEMASMLVRTMKWEVEEGQMTSFTDDAHIPAWAKPFVEAAHGHGILLGRAGNQFVPDGQTTRAEAAVVLLRLWKVLH